MKKKIKLAHAFESYWNMLPQELKDLILERKESQELIDWRESRLSRGLCRQIKLYRRVRQRWQIGHVQCRPFCYLGVKRMRVYGWWYDLRGVIHKAYLGSSLEDALINCNDRRVNYRNDEWMLMGVGILRAPFH